MEYEVEVPEGVIVTDQNFGFATKEDEEPVVPEDSETVEPSKVGTITGVIFNDADTDGVIDPGELAISGVKVELLDANGNVIATTTTDENGRYQFDSVPEGDYQIRVENMDEFDQTTDPVNGTTNPSTTVDVTVGQGEVVENQDFGFVVDPAPSPGPVEGSSDLELKEILPGAAIALIPLIGGALSDIGGRLPGMPAPSTSPNGASERPATSTQVTPPRATQSPAPAQSANGGTANTGGSVNSARTTTPQKSSGSVTRTLANTGASVIGLMILAGILVLVGIMLVFGARRRNED